MPTLILTYLVLIATSLPKIVQAEDPPDITQVNQLFYVVMVYIRIIGYTAAVAAIIYAGMLYFTAYGNEERPRLAKRAIMGAIIGIILIALSQTIIYAILGETAAPDNPEILAPTAERINDVAPTPSNNNAAQPSQ